VKDKNGEPEDKSSMVVVESTLRATEWGIIVSAFGGND
jgi:hypothetical protein